MPADLEFVPFDQPQPRGGRVVDLRDPEFGAPPLDARLADNLVGAHALCVEGTQLTVVVGYPFAGQYAVTVTASTPAGLTRAELLRQLVRIYSAMYEGATSGTAKPVGNARVDSSRFGIARHALSDLVIERVVVVPPGDGDRGPVAWISLGS